VTVTSACLSHTANATRALPGSPAGESSQLDRLTIDPVRVTPLADAVADKIRELILTGGLEDGQRLPSVEVMTQQFGVSWTATREALRILQSEGLVTVQRGKHGGAVVRHPNAATAGYAVALVLRSLGADVRDVVEARGHIEPACAMLCARRPDRNDTIVADLRAHNAAAHDLVDLDEGDFVDSLLAFHRAIVDGCGSITLTLLAGIIDSISRAMVLRPAEAAPPVKKFARSAKLKSLEVHDLICDLIASGDDAGVSRVMAEHHAADAPTSAALRDIVDAVMVRDTRQHR
jgi:GntR family transcriptional repressor for pyruvate dehydrogenase complex